MADLSTCLSLQSFDPQDIAEINGYIQQAGGDAAAGVEMFQQRLQADLDALTDQVAEATGMIPGMENVPPDAPEDVRQLARKLGAGARMAELMNDAAMERSVAEMAAIPETVSVDVADDWDAFTAFSADRSYVDPQSGQELRGAEALLKRIYEESAQWATQGVRQQRRAIVLIGAPAAGKSTLAERLANDTGSRILDSDEIKKAIPEYQNGIGAAAVHEESSVLSKMLQASALETGDNLILPKVGDNPQKMERQVEALQNAGYEVDVVHMEVEPEEAFRRMVARYIGTGRLIPPQYASNAATKPAETYAYLRSKGTANGYAKIDNNQPFGQDPTVLEDVSIGALGAGLRQPDGQGGAGPVPGAAQADGAEPQLRVLKQSAARRAPEAVGRETGVAMPTNLASAAQLALDNKFNTGREFKLQLQELARAQHGEDLLAINDENQARVADFIFEDAMEAVQDNANAIGWYDNAVTRAKTEMAKLYPEIAEGGEAEFAFIWGLAVTSNGLKVDKNFELAAKVYEAWKDTGRFPTDAGIGTAAVQINNGLAMYDRLLEIFDGSWEAARDFMVTEQPVRDIEARTGIPISGEGKGEIIRGAGVLGPKIGNGFFSNLYGHFDGLTMDRWLMRSVGRWRGSLISINDKMVAKKEGEMSAVLEMATPKELEFLNGFFNGSGLDLTDPVNVDLEQLALQIAKRSQDPGWRKRFSAAAAGKGDLLRKMGNAQAKYLDGQVEAPAGAGERTFIRGAFRQALDRLQQEPGMEQLTMADLQALLWYPEKLLYESAKKAPGEEIKSYADDEAPDYGNAARNLVRNRLGQDGEAGRPQRDTGQPGPGADARVLNQSTPAFQSWFGDSVVTNEDGSPMVVYRGEHGERDGTSDFQTVLPSLSFGSPELASIYAETPNDLTMSEVAEAPQVMPVYLKIENPIIDVRDGDPFMDFSVITENMGLDTAVKFARKHAMWIEGTGNWEENFIDEYTDGVDAALDDNPEIVNELYLDAFVLLDDPEFVEAARAAGFDGAIHGGNGEGALETEYRVFDASQAKSVFNAGTFDPNDARILNQSRVDTPAFRAWFQNSKIVDEDGNPLVVYHGTGADFEAFDMSKVGQTDMSWFGRGFYTSESTETAERYSWATYRGGEGEGANVIPLYVKIENPFIMGGNNSDVPVSIADAISHVYDGVATHFAKPLGMETFQRSTQYVAPESELYQQGLQFEEQVQPLIDEWFTRVAGMPYREFLNRVGGELDVWGEYTIPEDGPELYRAFADKLPDEVQALGYDGMIVRARGRMDEIIAFEPSQLKSVFNAGTFDPNDARILNQPGTDNFDAWAGEGYTELDPDEVSTYDFTEEDGPYVIPVYHGTTHSFDTFIAAERGQVESQFGKTNYFTTSLNDAERNYAGEGPDLTGRLERRAEQIASDNDWDYDDSRAMEQARAELAGGQDQVMELWVRTEKPFIVGGDRSPLMQMVDDDAVYEEAIEDVTTSLGMTVEEIKAAIEEGDSRVEDEVQDAYLDRKYGALDDNPITDALYEIADKYELDKADLDNVMQMLMEDSDGSITTNAFEEILRADEGMGYTEDPNTGDLIQSQVIAEVIQALGFDSIILQNADKRFSNMDMDPGTAHIMVFDENNTNIKSATGNAGTFDRGDANIFRQDEAEPRGQIRIPRVGVGNATTFIDLLKGSDRSTFFHEIAHFFLEVMNELDDPSLARDMQTIRKFVGAKQNQKGFTTDQHETFARGFEAYLMEGKAPSLELADVFSTVKDWLVGIYTSIRGLNVELSDEMREVFDRMLASDEAIAAARTEQAMRPLFTTKPPSMSQTDWETYQRMARRSTEEAEKRLLAKTMAKITRETKAWWKDERASLRSDVEEEVNQRPEYRLIEALGNKKWIGEETVEMPDDMRLDRAVLVEQFGEDVLADLDRTKLGGRRNIYGKEGMTPGEAADFFGFDSAGAMIDTLRGTIKRNEMIDNTTDARMRERHGDPFTDGTIEAEAMAAIHNDQQAAAVAAEAREMARQLGRDPTGMTASVWRARAREMIAEMTVGEAAKPARFLAAERRAARESEAAFSRVARGGGEQALTEAYSAKERQILNQHLYTAARQVQERVEKARKKMMSYNKPSVREKLDGIYIEQIDGLLEEYDFRKRSPNQVLRASNLTEYVEAMTEAGREAELNIDTRLIKNARRMNYTQMSVDEFDGLVETIKNIDHMGRFKQKLIDRKRRRDLNNSAARVAASIRTNLKAKPITAKESKTLGWVNLLSKPDSVFIRLDGGKEFGPVWEEMKRGIDEGMGIESEMQSQMAERLHKVYSDHYTAKESRAAQKEKYYDGIDHPWSKQEILALALNMGNRDNYQRVTAENVHPTRQLNDEQIDTLLSTLDDNDWRFVQEHIDLINELWPELADAHKRRTGTTAKKIEAEVMYPGAPAFFKGGYYPIGYDPRRSQAAQRDMDSATDKYMSAGHGSSAQVNNGMTKQRQKTGGGRTIDYDLSVGFRHLRETVRLIALGEAVDNTYRVLNHADVRAALADTGNLDTHQLLNLWVRDVAMGPVFNSDRINSLFRAAKNNFTLSRLAFNLKTVLLQATGITQSAVVIGKRNMARGMLSYYSNPNQALSFIEEVSPKMRERKSTFQKDMYDFLTSTQDSKLFGEAVYEKGKRVIGQAGFEPIVMMQYYVVDVPTWMGAFAKYMNEYDGDQERAALAADKMVERSQDTGLISERSAVERGTTAKWGAQQDIIRLFTTLSGYMMTKMNRAGVRYLQGKAAIGEAGSVAGKTAAAANMALDMMILYSFEAIMMGLLWELLDEDDGQEDLAEFLLRETGTTVVSGIPLVRDAASAMSGYGEGGVYGSYTGMPSRWWKQNVDQADGFPVLDAEWDRAWRRSWLDIIGATTGLPTTQTARIIEGFLDADETPLSEALLGSNPLNRD